MALVQEKTASLFEGLGVVDRPTKTKVAMDEIKCMNANSAFVHLKKSSRKIWSENGETEAIITCPCSVKRSHPLGLKLENDSLTFYCNKKCSLESILSAANLKNSEIYIDGNIKISNEDIRVDTSALDAAKKYIEHSEIKEFATDALPPLLQEYVGQIQAVHKDSSPILSTIGVLSTLSAFARHKLVADGFYQRLHPNIWSITISESGSFKTTAMQKGTQVLRDIDRELGDGNQAYEFVNSATWAGYLREFDEKQGGLIMLSEFASWLKDMSKEFGGSKSQFTSIYDVTEPIKVRTKSDGATNINEPYLSILGVTTVDFVRDLITPSDLGSGFIPRFLLFAPPNKSQRVPDFLPDNRVDTNTIEWPSYQAIRHICLGLRGDHKTTLNLKDLSDDAKEYGSDAHRLIYEYIHQQDDAIVKTLESFARRWSPTMIKLAMLMQQAIDRTNPLPSIQAMAGAYSVIRYAQESTVRLLTHELGRSPMQNKEQAVLNYIAKKGGTVTARILEQSRTLNGGYKDYEYVVETLVRAGKIAMSDGPKTSRVLKLL